MCPKCGSDNIGKIHEVSLNVQAGISDNVIETSMKTKFSFSFLYSADNFTMKAKKLEEKYSSSNVPANIKKEHRSYVVSSIISSFTFLESNINEFYIDVCDGYYEEELDSGAQNDIKEFWNNLNQLSLLRKYQKALKLLDKDCFDKKKEPCQLVNDLRKLRNELIHYKTGFVSDNSVHYLEEALENRLNKDDYNPFTGTGNPFFPHKCLSASCADWGLESVLKFVKTFYNKIDIEPPYRKIETYKEIENKYISK